MKQILDLQVQETAHPREDYVFLRLTNPLGAMPPMEPGQFVEVRVDDSPTTFLRRPISVNYADEKELWLLIHCVGEGTRHLARLQAGDKLNCLLPLGHGYTISSSDKEECLLIGGGVGTAPLLYLGQRLRQEGHNVTFILGGRSASDILQKDLFKEIGEVYITTNDGTLGEKGFVTQHSVLSNQTFTKIYTCGPKPMMQAVVRWAKAHNVACEVSLENMMACGLGACLCCVENTKKGHVCVCKDGPVFDMNELNWE